MVELRDSSNDVLKQWVWGRTYVDELVQISLNDDPTDAGEDDCETSSWALQDANFNVLGIVESDGGQAERYEYTPYGRRTVYKRPNANAAIPSAPLLASQPWPVSSIDQAYGLCDIGHQGLLHDKEFGLIHNRARALHPTLGRFLQRDPVGYVDGMSLYEYTSSAPVHYTDPRGTDRWIKTTWTVFQPHPKVTYTVYDENCSVKGYRECEFAELLPAEWWVEDALLTARNIVWEGPGNVQCLPVRKPRWPPAVKSDCKADLYLHNAMQLMESNPPRYRWPGHTCLQWSYAVLELGIASATYDAWAEYDFREAVRFDEWARHRESIGDLPAAQWNRGKAEELRSQSTYNTRQARQDLITEIEEARGGHAPFWATSERIW